MIWHVALKLNEVSAQGRDYPWTRPEGCLQCGRFRVWGHGFVGRYFEGYEHQVLLRCYRCPGCGCVMTPRPIGYFRRIRSPVGSIWSQLAHRLFTQRWLGSPPGASRMRHWLKNLRRHALAWLGWAGDKRLLAAFVRLVKESVVPVGRAIQTDKRAGVSPPQ